MVQRLLEEVLPLDEQRRREAEVWLTLAARAQVDQAARARLQEADDGVQQAARFAADALRQQRRLAADRDPNLEAARLHALLDGLTLHALSRPAAVTPQRLRAIVAAHLDELAR